MGKRKKLTKNDGFCDKAIVFYSDFGEAYCFWRGLDSVKRDPLFYEMSRAFVVLARIPKRLRSAKRVRA